MTILTFLDLFLISLLGLSALVGYQIRLIRLGRVTAPSGETSLWPLCQAKIDRFYATFSWWFKQFGRQVYFYSLVIAHQAVVAGNFLLLRVEQKFSRLIDSINGRGFIGNKGPTSLFISQITSKTDK